MGTIATRRSSGLPLKGHAHLPGTTWKIGDDIFLEIHKGELGKRSSNNADSIRSQNNIDERNLCYVNKEGCFIYNFPHERGDNSFFMISTKPFSHDMLMKNLAGRQKYYAEENRMPMTKPISQIQDFYNKYMNAVDIADQCALEYSKEDSKFYRSTRWVNVIFTWYFDDIILHDIHRYILSLSDAISTPAVSERTSSERTSVWFFYRLIFFHAVSFFFD